MIRVYYTILIDISLYPEANYMPTVFICGYKFEITDFIILDRCLEVHWKWLMKEFPNRLGGEA